MFWLGIYGSVLADMIAQYHAREVMLYSFSMLAGIMVWDVAMALAASAFRRWLTGLLLTGISVFSGLSLVGFGVFFGWEAFRLLIS